MELWSPFDEFGPEDYRSEPRVSDNGPEAYPLTVQAGGRGSLWKVKMSHRFISYKKDRTKGSNFVTFRITAKPSNTGSQHPTPVRFSVTFTTPRLKQALTALRGLHYCPVGKVGMGSMERTRPSVCRRQEQELGNHRQGISSSDRQAVVKAQQANSRMTGLD